MYKNIIIVILTVVVVLLLSSSSSSKVDPIIIERIDTLYQDTIVEKWKKGKDIPYKIIDSFYKDTIIHDTITLDICKEIKSYVDSYNFDSSSVTIYDTIGYNKLLGRSVKAIIAQKTIVKVRELRTPPPASKGVLYWGFMGTKQNQTYGFGAGVMYKTPEKGIIQFNITNNSQFQIGYYSKIF